jgi:hypothetical protein
MCRFLRAISERWNQRIQCADTRRIDSNSGVYTGTFAIISAQDQQTVVWAGNYTQVYNLDPNDFGCGALTFCANLGPAFGDETFNGAGLSYLLELNGFTWFVASK